MNANKTLAVLVAVGLSSVAAIPAFAASATHNLNVQAQITGNCRFNTAGPTDLLIGTPVAGPGVIDQSEAAPATGSAQVVYRCTTGTTWQVVADNGTHFSGSRRVCTGANDCMPYALNVGATQAGVGHGAGGDLNLTVNASIAVNDFVNAPAGTYNDTVVLTIQP